MKFSKALGLILILIPLAAYPLPARDIDTAKAIDRAVSDLAAGITKIQEDIHSHPELSMQEMRTAALVADYFRKLGLEVRTGIGGTGVLGVLKGGKPGPVIGMRGDMDALPITEETGLPYASTAKGVRDGQETGIMHACGHDFHTSILLGVAAVMAGIRNELPGTILFIAQPGEEWGDGADRMLRDGLFKDLKPEAMFAFHVEETIPAGTVKYTPGWAAANCDGFVLNVLSEGGHGAVPSSCVDPIVVGAQIVVALQVMVSREIDVHNDAVITVGSFHAGSANNIIPREAFLKATIRSYGDDQRQALKQKIERLISNICEAAGAKFALDYNFQTPALYNNPALMTEVLPTVEKVLGGKQFLVQDPPEMGGEDFSYFAKEVPSVMLKLGVMLKGKEGISVHSPYFVADQKAIPVGMKVMSRVLWDYGFRHRTKPTPRLPGMSAGACSGLALRRASRPPLKGGA
jgi:amidohydrolase